MEQSFREQLKGIRDEVPLKKTPQNLGAAAAKEKEETKKVTVEELAEKAVKVAFGEDVFEREGIKKPETAKSAILNNQLKAAKKGVDRVRKHKGTPEQIEERQKQVEFLEKEIKKAEKAREFEIERLKKTEKVKITKPQNEIKTPAREEIREKENILKSRLNKIEELKMEVDALIEREYLTDQQKEKYSRINEAFQGVIEKNNSLNKDDLKWARNKMLGVESDFNYLFELIYSSNSKSAKKLGTEAEKVMFKKEEKIDKIDEEIKENLSKWGGTQKELTDFIFEKVQQLPDVNELKSLNKENFIKNLRERYGIYQNVLEAVYDKLPWKKAVNKEAIIKEEALAKEAEVIKREIEKMPEVECEKIDFGLRNIGFFVQEWKSNMMASFCNKFAVENHKSAIGRFFSSLAGTYHKDAEKAQKDIEEREEIKTSMKQLKNVGFLMGNIMKYGRTVADVVGWTAGSPLRYVMLGAQFFSRGAEAAKEARLKNEEVIEKTRVKDINEAVEEAWKIYETAKLKSNKSEVSKETLEKAYIENLPQDLLNRLKKSEPGTATGILLGIFQKILRKDVELAIKYGKFSEASFENRLKEFDKIIGHYGTVDTLAMGARYAETAGKAVIAGVQIETAALLMQRLPEIMSKISSISLLYESEGVKPAGVSSVIEETKGVGIGEKPAGASAVISEKYAELAIIKKGEGVWHAVYRQLENNLRENPEKFGLKSEDLNNTAKIKTILNQQAGKLLVEQGYIKPDGSEIRITKPGVKVFLDADNKIKIEGVGKTVYEFPSEEISHEVLEKVEAESKIIQEHGYLPEESSPEKIEEERIQRIFEGKGSIAMPEVLETEIPPTEIISKNVATLGDGWIKRGISIESLQKLAKEPAIAGRWFYLTNTEGKIFKVLGGFESKMAAKYALEKMTKMEK